MEQGLENVLQVLVFGTGALLLGLTALALLTLVIASDRTWLSVLAFVLGWGIALFTGLFVWGVLQVPAQLAGWSKEDVEFTIWIVPTGYPVVAILVAYWFHTMPRDRSLPWKRALTSGALVGFGVGTGGKVLKGGGGFGGFGGGSFGGGGASGSFQGAVSSGTASGAGGLSSGAVEAAGAAVGAGTTMRDLADETASAAAERAPSSAASGARTEGGSEGQQASRAPASESWTQRMGLRHGCGFLLVALVFAGIGWGLAGVLPEQVGWGLLLLGGAYLAIQLLRRAWSEARDGRSGSAFKGGEASASWS